MAIKRLVTDEEDKGELFAAAALRVGERDVPAYGMATPVGREGNAFAALVERLPADRDAAIDAIRSGFAVGVLKDAGQYFDVPASRIRAIVRLPETTALALARRGVNMDPAVSERIWRLADLAHMAREVFEDEAAATAWLRSPNRSFHNGAPMDSLDTEPGAMSVRQVLNAIASGGVA